MPKYTYKEPELFDAWKVNFDEDYPEFINKGISDGYIFKCGSNANTVNYLSVLCFGWCDREEVYAYHGEYIL